MGKEDLDQVSRSSLEKEPMLLIYNTFDPSSVKMLVYWEGTGGGGCYEIVIVHANGQENWREVIQTNICSCVGPPCFINHDQFAVLDLERKHILIKDMRNETVTVIDQSFSLSQRSGIFSGGGKGKLIIRIDNNAILFSVESNVILGEINVPEMTNAVWANDSSKVAILCKYGLIIADAQMKQLVSVGEKVKIWSGTWDASPSGGSANEMFVYTTLHHIKYCIVACEEIGIIQPLNKALYAMKVVKDKLFGISRDGLPQIVSIDTTGVLFKLYVLKKKVWTSSSSI
jgi:coatomer protein complex subunit alpha (xenin)